MKIETLFGADRTRKYRQLGFLFLEDLAATDFDRDSAYRVMKSNYAWREAGRFSSGSSNPHVLFNRVYEILCRESFFELYEFAKQPPAVRSKIILEKLRNGKTEETSNNQRKTRRNN